MNAVEAAEQLIAVGRRVQAAERRWQQATAPLQTAALWEGVLADPLAALETLLAAAGTPASSAAPWPAPRAPRSGVQPGPLPPTAPPAFAAQAPAENRHGSEPGAPASAFPAHPRQPEVQTRSPAQAMRLARSQSSLLGILAANVEGTGPGGASGGRAVPDHAAPPADPGAAAAGAGASGDSGLPSLGLGLPGALPGSGETAGPAPAPSPAAPPPARTGWGWAAAPAAPSTDGEQAAAADAGAPRPAARAGALIDPGGDRRLWPRAAADGDFAADAQVPALNRAVFQRAPAEAHPAAASLQPADAAATPYSFPANDATALDAVASDAAAWPAAPDSVAPDSAARPLSRAQIDQVLAALDERLELLLLRTYGAAGQL